MNTQEISRALKNTATLLELRGENPFKLRVYATAAELLDSLEGELEDFVRNCREGKIKGIGPQLAQSIESLYERGRLPLLEELEKEFPKTILELFAVPGLGPKKIKRLYDDLSIAGVADLKRACEANKLAELKGFGIKTQEKLLAALELQLSFSARGLRTDAELILSMLSKGLSQVGAASRIELSGQFRRGLPVLDKVDVVVETVSDERCFEAIADSGALVDPKIENRIISGSTERGLPVSVSLASPDDFFSALFHTTGSEEYLAEFREDASRKNPTRESSVPGLAGSSFVPKSEEEIFAAAGVPWRPAELREAGVVFQGSVSLVTLDDIRGILHAHSTYSDGKNTLAEMAEAVRSRGYEYFGVTDHSQSAVYANGLREVAIMKQHAEIDELNSKLAPFRIFKGIEADILADGSLDYPDDILALFDFVVISVHSRFSMSQAAMTERIIKALQNPFADILAHPTGRLLLKREGYTIDFQAVLEAAASNNVAVEINSNPKRLDLDWTQLERAKALGIPLPINPDAHSVQAIDNVRHGVAIARRAAVEPKHVLNCRSLQEVESYFCRKRAR